jgi:hypothetical protein
MLTAAPNTQICASHAPTGIEAINGAERRLGARSPRTVCVTYCDGSPGLAWDAVERLVERAQATSPCALCAFRADS